MKNKIAIIVGYFQPFHNEHEKLIKKISKKYNKIIIYAIYPDLNNTEHPFTIQEVNKMIKNSLEEINNYKIENISNLLDIPLNKKYFYFCTDRNFDINEISKCYKNLKIKEQDIIKLIYNKDLNTLNFVNEKNYKYLRRLVIPF